MIRPDATKQLAEAIAKAPEVETDHAVKPVSFFDLKQQHPRLRPPVVDGLLRRGETGNIIAAPKVGKSWLAYYLGLCINTGSAFLDLFDCDAGPVLLIDNELHPETIAHRIPKVAEAMGIDHADYVDTFDVLHLRGRGVSMLDLSRYIDQIDTGYYRAVILDAWYRFIPQGLSENANADVMTLYNRLDQYAAQTDAAWFVIHHSSKGNQGEKNVTDVGAGAGSQARAADAHIVLRQHEEDDAVVLEAAVRSFPPVEPVALRWDFPTWTRAYSLDTTALKGRKTKGEQRQDERDAEGMETIRNTLAGGAMTPRQLREETGFGAGRVERLLDKLTACGQAAYDETKVRGNPARTYHLSA